MSIVFVGPGVIRDPSGKHHGIGKALDGLGFSDEHLRLLVEGGQAKEIPEDAAHAPPASQIGASLEKLDADYVKQG